MSLGNQNITDVWMDASVDSTVGVRAFLAQNTSANGGAGVAVQFIAVAAGNLLGTGAHNIWPDNAADVSVLTGGATNLPLTIGTNQNGLSDVHVNMGMTDITPADAYFATTRSLTKLNTSTYAGLGYNSTTNVGNSILTSEGTGTKATPVKFALFDNDPITAQPIRGYKSVPIGAAPIVFVYNNNGDSTLHDILTGVIGDGTSSGSFPLAKLFDGDTSCDTSNAAFNPPDLGAKPMHLFLREPLSGTMNTTEFNLFRTVGQTSNTQEKHVDPSVDNPLTAKPCGTGDRNRAIGTGEVIGKAGSAGVLGVAHGFGYIFSSFANLQKFGGASPAANYNYLTLDGVDPFGFNTGVVPQYTFPNCSGPCAESTYWTGVSYPNIRNGSYKAYSVYRWVIDSTDVDAYGPTVLAQSTQDHINDSTGVADFIPFTQTGNADGLPVYRSHFLVSGTYKTTGTAQETFNYCNVASGNADCNGTATSASVSEGGNTLGTGEAGGDVGGLVEGPFHTGYTSGYVTTTSTCTSGKGFKVTRKTNVGDAFIAGASWENQNITIGGVTYQVSPIALTATVLYVGGTACGLPTPPTNTTGLYYYIGVGGTGLAAPNGIISKKE